MSKRIPRDMDRVRRMAELYKSGKTLQQIGDEYGMTRERVRQLISFVGLSRKSGGAHFHAKRSEVAKHAKKDTWALKKWGCTYAQYRNLVLMNWPTRAFCYQKRTAGHRGIEWKFTLWQWWTVWQESGKWEQRGRGHNKYVMARKGDVGPYEAGNVFICTLSENSSNRKQKTSGLPIGVSKKTVKNYVAYVAQKMIGGKKYRIGSFKTPEAAGAAYQSFNA